LNGFLQADLNHTNDHAMKTLFNPLLGDISACPPLQSPEFYELLIQFLYNLVVLFILSRALYFRWNRDANHLFTQIIAGVVVFLLCALLRWVNLELRMVIGLFAIFAIIRFRTLHVPVKEMAYLFMVVGISAINALLRPGQCLQWIVITNLIVISLTWALEKLYFSRRLVHRTIMFGKTDLLKPSMYQALLQELKTLTELNIMGFEIGKVDYIKKQSRIRIYFQDDGHTIHGDLEPETTDD
jgi:hypothetical protein